MLLIIFYLREHARWSQRAVIENSDPNWWCWHSTVNCGWNVGGRVYCIVYHLWYYKVREQTWLQWDCINARTNSVPSLNCRIKFWLGPGLLYYQLYGGKVYHWYQNLSEEFSWDILSTHFQYDQVFCWDKKKSRNSWFFIVRLLRTALSRKRSIFTVCSIQFLFNISTCTLEATQDFRRPFCTHKFMFSNKKWMNIWERFRSDKFQTLYWRTCCMCPVNRSPNCARNMWNDIFGRNCSNEK